MGLGSFPDIDLANSRIKASEYRNLAKEGIDPIEARKIEAEKVPNFTVCAAQFIRARRRGWKNAKHARQWVSTLKTYARPIIGSKQVDVIDTKHILEILTPIWRTKIETAKRIQSRIENILNFATAHKYRDAPNPAQWRGHLDMMMPNPSSVKVVTHHPAMPYTDVPKFMVELSNKNNLSALALRLLIMTATRTSEILKAEWSEIDLENAIWVIPAERMKTKREHRVPLTKPMIVDLMSLPRIEGHPYLFPGLRHGKHLSNMALLQLMRGMGYGIKGQRGAYVPHGFRSSFRDWSGEVANFPRDVAEMALAHAIKDKVEAAYRRGDLFEKRRKMMEAWTYYIHFKKS